MAEAQHRARRRTTRELVEPIHKDRRHLSTILPRQRMYALRAAINLFGSEAVRPRLGQLLRDQGIDYSAVMHRTGPVCLRRIVVDDCSCSFEVDEEYGELAFIFAVHDLDAESVIDLVAWPIKRPRAFATYLAFAGLLGGDAAINPASFVDGPCPIWASPLSWLQSDLRGCVVLRAEVAAPVLDQAPGKFQCEG
jgi:hypothetical protein